MPKILTLHYDSDLQDPCDGDGFKVYSFNNRHRSHQDLSKFFDDHGRPHMWLRNKLRAGTAFSLSYYEHGACEWSLSGEGPNCRWDSVARAGLLVWEGKPKDLRKTPAERAVSAREFLETYTAWCNGYGYGYSVEELVTLPCGHTETRDVDSCFGFYGNDLEYMFECIRAAVGDDQEVEVKGEARDLTGYHKYKNEPEVRP